jgi:hypothetical protein
LRRSIWKGTGIKGNELIVGYGGYTFKIQGIITTSTLQSITLNCFDNSNGTVIGLEVGKLTTTARRLEPRSPFSAKALRWGGNTSKIALSPRPRSVRLRTNRVTLELTALVTVQIELSIICLEDASSKRVIGSS